MSAYVVDPRTIDYLVQWAEGRTRDDLRVTCDRDKLPERAQLAHDGLRLRVSELMPNDLGQILLTENVRSVRYRYPNDASDNLPGPIDQTRVWRYQWRPVDARKLKASWVIMSCRCLAYQSCEHPEWESSPAKAILDAIKESAVHALCEDAPWGVTDDDLAGLATV